MAAGRVFAQGDVSRRQVFRADIMIRAGMVFAVFSPVGDMFSLLHGRLED